MSSNSRDFRWLVGASAAEMLASVERDLEAKQNALAIIKRLRKTTTPTRAALVLEQAQLRIRGRTKFERAGQMFFTRRAWNNLRLSRLRVTKANDSRTVVIRRMFAAGSAGT